MASILAVLIDARKHAAGVEDADAGSKLSLTTFG